MAKILDFNSFKQNSLIDTDYRTALIRMNYDQIMDEILNFRETYMYRQHTRESIRKGFTLFSTVVTKDGFGPLKELCDMYCNNLEQEFKIIRGTYN